MKSSGLRELLSSLLDNIADENLSDVTQAAMFCNRVTSSVFDISSDVSPETTGNHMKCTVTLKVQCVQKHSKSNYNHQQNVKT